MKWIGQHIWDFISRFRTTVYIENLETSSEENVLVVDSDGKVTKNTTLGGSDLTITDAGDNRIVTSSGGSALLAETYATFQNNANTSTLILYSNEDTDDHFKISTTTNGLTDIRTVDDSGSNAAHMHIQPAGNVRLEPVSEIIEVGIDNDDITTIKKRAHSDNNGGRLYIKSADATAGQTDKDGGMLVLYGGVGTGTGTTGPIAFYGGPPAASTGTSINTARQISKLHSPNTTSTIQEWYEPGSGTDSFSIDVTANGATTLITNDGGGTSANLQITADGTAELAGTTVTLDSAADIELEVGAGANYVQTAGVFRGSNIGTIQDDKLPVSPTLFIAESYRFHPQYNLASGGITMASASVNAYAEVVIPRGYTATSCTMFATDLDNDGTIRCYEGSTIANTSSAVASASTFSSGSVTHDFGANDIDGNGAKTVIIEWDPGDTSDILHGGYITIEKTT